MNFLRSFLIGIISAVVSIAIVMGAISLSLTEGFILAPPDPTPTAVFQVVAAQALPTPTPLPPTAEPAAAPTPTGQTWAGFPTPTPAVVLVPTLEALPAGSQGMAAPAPLPNCPSPDGWVAYTLQPGDTLFKLSVSLGVDLLELQQVNCLTTAEVSAGSTLWLPFLPDGWQGETAATRP